MIKNYIKTAFRNISRSKLHSFVNISGFAIGIASFIIIMSYVKHELSFDKFHENYNSIYQVSIDKRFSTSAPIALALKNQIPEIESIVRIDFNRGGGKSAFLKDIGNNNEEPIQVKDIIYADSTFFDIFTYKMLFGDPKTSLKDPNSLVLGKSTSMKIFGVENSVGKTVHFMGESGKIELDYKITGIIDDIPKTSSMQFNGIVSLSTLKPLRLTGSDMDEDWYNWGYKTFAIFKPSLKTQVENKAKLIWIECEKNAWDNISHEELEVISLNNVPFYANNKLQFIYLISFIGLLILVIATINFVNLSIAKSSTRIKEIGIKKVVGSSKFMLIKQLISEAVLISLIATFLALIIAEIVKPFISEAIGVQLSIGYIKHPSMLLLFFAGAVFIGILSGIYPALLLSSFSPLSTLKNEFSLSTKGKTYKQTLIVFQFVVSISLIIATIVISKQVNLLKSKDLGVDISNVIYTNPNQSILRRYDLFKQNALKNPNVKSLALTGGNLGQRHDINITREFDGIPIDFQILTVDPDFINLMGVEIIEGRDFSWDLETDRYNTIIINETALKEFNLDKPFEAEILMFNGNNARIIGIMKDFHAESFHQSIAPSVLWYAPGWYWNLNIKLSNNNLNQTLDHIKENWNEISPDLPFEYHFLDEKYEALYESEVMYEKVITSFSILAIFIAFLGLFGLISFTTERRIKEIGIRKVNGASIFEILKMLNLESIKWIIISFSIACPIAWFFMNKWLQDFAFKTNISWWIFVVAGILVSLVALLTVSWQSWGVAKRNPVEALRCE